MYHSLLPILKPLVYEGKSGILEVSHVYNDEARLFLKEGMVEQVETSKLLGKKAVVECTRWVSITTNFLEGEEGEYTLDPEIDTTAILSYLEKVSKNIEVIQKKISDNSLVLEIDSNKLNETNKLHADDFKIALLFDGKRSIQEAMSISGKPELAVLTHTCRLILSGVAREASLKNVMAEQDRKDFFQSLDEKLMDLVGPAASILVEDALAETQLEPDMLAEEDVQPLLLAISGMLDDDGKVELDKWEKDYLMNGL